MVIKTTEAVVALVEGAFGLAKHCWESTLVQMGYHFFVLYVAAGASVEFLVGTSVRLDRAQDAEKYEIGGPSV